MSELKPCPFCGKMPLVLDDGKRINLGCTNNKCFAPVRFTINNTLPDLEWKLIGLWNTRPLEDDLIAERDALKAKLDEIIDLDDKASEIWIKVGQERDALKAKLEAAKEAITNAMTQEKCPASVWNILRRINDQLEAE